MSGLSKPRRSDIDRVWGSLAATQGYLEHAVLMTERIVTTNPGERERVSRARKNLRLAAGMVGDAMADLSYVERERQG